jgi:HK97 family phage major capsid protein
MAKEIQETEVQLDEKALEAITATVTEKVGNTIEAKMKEVFEAQKEEALKKLEDAEKVISKNLGNVGNIADERKEVRLVKSAMALLKGDRETLKKYNEVSLDLRTKAGYANSDINADGGYIVADPEFEAEVQKLAPNYGVSLNEANVVTISSNSVKTNKRGSNVTMYETSQAGQKTGTKLTIEQVTVELRKFAAIALATDELVEDAAIDFWNEVTQGFAEEIARIADVLVFTDTNVDYPGIMRQAGTIVESVGTNITDATWDDLLNAESKVPSAARANMKHYMHRTVWNVFVQSKDDEGRYQWFPTMGAQTPWGTPVVLSDSLPDVNHVADGNEPFIVTGDLKRIKLYRKRGLVLERSNQATVRDADGESVNLWERDMSALRAVSRMVSLNKFPEAFVITGTGTVS